MYSHTGLAYANADEFLAAAVPYVREGLHQRGTVTAVLSGQKAGLLRAALGEQAQNVQFSPEGRYGEHQARAFSGFVQEWYAARERGVPALRILTEPGVEHLDDALLGRWVYTENATNDVLPDSALSLMCAYDAASSMSREHVEVSHRHMADGATIAPSTNFIAPGDFSRSAHALAWKAPAAGARAAEFDSRTLEGLRRFIQTTARRFQLGATRASDLTIAAAEAAANAIEHGSASRGIAGLWHDDAEVVCEIRNPGTGIAAGNHGFVPPHRTAERGRGVWMMRQLCDWVDLRAHERETVVRLHMRT